MMKIKTKVEIIMKKWTFIIAIIGAMGSACLLLNTGVSEASITHSHPVTLASVWDIPTESYSGNKEITVYRSASCSCCGGWIEHLEKHGFQVTDITTEDMQTIKEQYNLPPELISCHTGIIDGYVMEGHIPADDIKGFLRQKPDLVGLAVPAMPLGTPGMEAGDIKQPFAVLGFDHNGEIEVFKEQ